MEPSSVVWKHVKYVMYGEEDGFVSGWYIDDGHNAPIWYRGWLSLTHWVPLPGPPLTDAANKARRE